MNMNANIYAVVDQRSTGERRVVYEAREPAEAAAVASMLNRAGDPTAHVELVHAEEMEILAQ
jgi:hypothetical protein